MASEPPVSKSDFAAMANTARCSVSRWISEGKIYGDALVGEGRNAKIIPSIALRQIRMSMDVGQRLGNGAKTNLKAPARGGPSAKGSASPAGADPGEFDGLDPALDEQIKREKLREMQIRTRKAFAAEREREGLYTLTSDVTLAMNKALSRAKSFFEGSLPTLAEDVARRHGTEPREEEHALREAYKAYRVALEGHLRKSVDACSEHTQDDDGTEP